MLMKSEWLRVNACDLEQYNYMIVSSLFFELGAQ